MYEDKKTRPQNYFLFVLVAFGVVSGCAGKHRTLMVIETGQVTYYPRPGETLEFVNYATNLPQEVKWTGPKPWISPCKEYQSNQSNPQQTSSTCTINFQTKSPKLYHYICVDGNGKPNNACPDPVVPGPHSHGRNAGSGVKGGGGERPPFQRESNGGTVVEAEAGDDNGTSAVYYFPPDGGEAQEGVIPAHVGDVVLFEDAGGSWSVNIPNAVCKEQQPLTDTGTRTCTINEGAQSEQFDVLFQASGSNASKPGKAQLNIINK